MATKRKPLAVNLTWIHKSELRSLLDCLADLRGIVPDYDYARREDASAKRAMGIIDRADRWLARAVHLRANMDAK